MRINGKDKVFFGVDKFGDRINLTRPSYDCKWYWSFGYLGNKDCHYHLSGYQNGRNINMYDALVSDYVLADHIVANLWSFCEQALAIYTLKDAAEVLYRGGANMTTNPLRDIIKAHNGDDMLNQKLLPILLQKFWDDFGDSSKASKEQ
jgi:hypothetical protein